MKRFLSICLSIVILLLSLSTVFAEEKNQSGYRIGNSDIVVPFAEHEADVLSKLGLLKGTQKGFELEKPVTRAEAVTIVLRMVGEDKLVNQSVNYQQFSDVKASHWAFGSISYAAGKGYVNGTSKTTFEPERLITGQEFVKILLSAMGYEGIGLDNVYEAGIKAGLLVNNYTKLAVSTKDYKLIRNDVVNICYSALFAKMPDGRLLKDLLSEKGIVNEEELNQLIISEYMPSQKEREFTWQLNDYMPTDENYMFSPSSIKMALALAANGADDTTRKEIMDILGIEDIDEYNKWAAKLIKDYSENEKVQLNVANSVWLNIDKGGGVEFEDAYKNTVQNYYQAEVEKVNTFDAVPRVNHWVNQKTEGKIKDIISDGNFLACLVNAIYFKGEWAKTFDEFATKEAEFTDRNGKRTKRDFMNTLGYFEYYKDDSVEMIRLPYKDGRTSMYIAIPADSSNREINYENNIEKMTGTRVQVSIPKFETEFKINLKEFLTEMGIETAFNPAKANFDNMFEPDIDAYIDDIIHKTYIKVDERGTEAAAVTAVIINTTALIPEEPVIFKADRPFTYFIRDDINGEILFVGEQAY